MGECAHRPSNTGSNGESTGDCLQFCVLRGQYRSCDTDMTGSRRMGGGAGGNDTATIRGGGKGVWLGRTKAVRVKWALEASEVTGRTAQGAEEEQQRWKRFSCRGGEVDLYELLMLEVLASTDVLTWC